MGAHRARRALGVAAMVSWLGACSAGSGTADSTRLCDALADVEQSYGDLSALVGSGSGDARSTMADAKASAERLISVSSGRLREAASQYARASGDLTDLLATYDFDLAAARADPRLGEIIADADAADAIDQISAETGSRCDATSATSTSPPSTVPGSDALAPGGAPVSGSIVAEGNIPPLLDTTVPVAVETAVPPAAETTVAPTTPPVAPTPDPVPVIDSVAPLPTTPVADPGSIEAIVSGVLDGSGATPEQTVCVREGLLGIFGEARLLEMLQTASSTPEEDAAAAGILEGCGLDPTAILGPLG